MPMFELIVLAIIFSCIFKSKKKKNLSTGQKPIKRMPQPVKSTERPNQGRRVQNKPEQNRPLQNKPEKMSTTEMLEAKAREDEEEHQLEQKRQSIRNKKHYGHHNYAERYIMGDPVPKGKKMVFCAYCGAENLIPTYSTAKDYNCYFCREDM